MLVYPIEITGLTNTYCGFCSTVNRQRLFSRVRRCTRSYHNAALDRVFLHAVQGKFDKVESSSEIDIDDLVYRLDQVTPLIIRIVEIICVFAYSGISDSDVESSDPLQCCNDIRPLGNIAV